MDTVTGVLARVAASVADLYDDAPDLHGPMTQSHYRVIICDAQIFFVTDKVSRSAVSATHA
jgi:hypothetical protein